ncbi:MAG: hypothetical protein QF437_14250 [Planctomycetota bacterium]|nr:hypothetical protein [Planctomycetota bacterium]
MGTNAIGIFPGHASVPLALFRGELRSQCRRDAGVPREEPDYQPGLR